MSASLLAEPQAATRRSGSYGGYLRKRLLQFVIVVFIGMNITYLITHATPIDPVEQTISAATSFGSTSPEAIAKTDEPSVAYKYVTGLKGFTAGEDTRVVWRDDARGWQHYAFGGSVNKDPVGLQARNRLAILESGGGS